ncbi:major capsid protein [Oligoflexus tunisiensis]|uniref:major capsid protein n=1 Tax=Oligoflexus tunisiensis TaxID=708132 RepID=UPI00159F1117|nr:major capsid protein [Oligoflexus tunisiensis]
MIYSTYYLNRLVEKLVPKSRYFLDRYFPTEVQSDKEEVFFDEADGEKAGIMPFVHPLVEAPMLRSQGYRTKSFKPAYMKEKVDLKPDRGFHRLAGEAFGGELTPMQRAEQALLHDVNRLYERHRNRLELMAAEVVKSGKLTIKGEGIDALLDFGRNSNLTKVLGAKGWADNTAIPSMTKWLEDLQREVAGLNNNQSRPRTCVLGYDAWDIFRNRPDIQKMLPEYIRGAELSIPQTPGESSFEQLIYKGYYGNVHFWVHEGKSDDGQFYIKPKQALFTCDEIRGVRHFGAILDLKAGLRAQPIFAKSWEIEDPSVRFVMLQSAPLLVTYDPNTACLVDVAA